MWLGERRGNLVDWLTQRWVCTTGRRVDLADHPWLDGPIGTTRGIGSDYFDKWAATEGLSVVRHSSGKGLLPAFADLSGPGFDAAAVDPAVAQFYERAVDFDMDVWSEWSGLFRPFGFLVSAVFSRRLEQLNLPLSSLDTSWGMTSEVVQVSDPVSGRLRANAWVRTLVKTGRIAYVGSYSVATPPGPSGRASKRCFRSQTATPSSFCGQKSGRVVRWYSSPKGGGSAIPASTSPCDGPTGRSSLATCAASENGFTSTPRRVRSCAPTTRCRCGGCGACTCTTGYGAPRTERRRDSRVVAPRGELGFVPCGAVKCVPIKDNDEYSA